MTIFPLLGNLTQMCSETGFTQGKGNFHPTTRIRNSFNCCYCPPDDHFQKDAPTLLTVSLTVKYPFFTPSLSPVLKQLYQIINDVWNPALAMAKTSNGNGPYYKTSLIHSTHKALRTQSLTPLTNMHILWNLHILHIRVDIRCQMEADRQTGAPHPVTGRCNLC